MPFLDFHTKYLHNDLVIDFFNYDNQTFILYLN